MGRIVWNSREREVALAGAERRWLAQIARGPAECAYGFSRGRHNAFELAEQLMAVVTSKHHLHGELRATLAAGPQAYQARDRFVDNVHLYLRVDGLELNVAGHRLHTDNVDLNTAILAGSEPVVLAAKIDGWCESHCWIDGPDRAWAADVIERAVAAGIYRRTVHVPAGLSGPAHDVDMGWDNVIGLLRETADGPVVLSYTARDSFPNSGIAGWTPPPMPDGWLPNWADDERGLAEWAATDPAEQHEHYLEVAGDGWYDLPEAEQWDSAMAGLRRSKPWGRLAADTLTEYTFGVGVTVYDLFAPDRDDRVRAAFAAAEGEDDACDS